mgnify:CR=1 FL=1
MPHETGGAAVFLGALALGAFLAMRHCLRIARRPAAHTLCVQALACLFGGLCVLFLAAAVRTVFALSTAVFGLLALCAIGFVFAAPILATIGLRDLAKSRVRYHQGFAQAVWAVVLPIGLIGGGLALMAARDERGAQLRSGTSTRRVAREGEFEHFEDLNFGFQSPGPDWWLMDRDEKKPWIKLEYRLSPAEAVSAFVRAVKVEPAIALHEAIERTKHPPGGAPARRSLRADYACTVNGFRGHVLEFEIGRDEGSSPLLCLMWIYTYDDVVYEVICLGEVVIERRLREEAQAMWSRFCLLDPVPATR